MRRHNQKVSIERKRFTYVTMNNFFAFIVPLIWWWSLFCWQFRWCIKESILIHTTAAPLKDFSIQFLNSISSLFCSFGCLKIFWYSPYITPKLHTHFQPQLASSTFIFDTSLFIYRIATKKKMLKLLLSSVERKRWQICEPTNSNKAHTVVVCAVHIMRFICS